LNRQHISSGSRFESEIGYSRAVVAGDWVFVSGTTGFDYSDMSIVDDAVQQTHGQALPIAALEVHVELLGLDGARSARNGGHQSGAIASDDIGQALTARADLGQIIIQPARQGGVHVVDSAISVDREEAGRRVIEEIYGVLEFLKDKISPIEMPRQIVIREKPLPKTAVGKLSRKDLLIEEGIQK
jgi:hypothetical protein